MIGCCAEFAWCRLTLVIGGLFCWRFVCLVLWIDCWCFVIDLLVAVSVLLVWFAVVLVCVGVAWAWLLRVL